MDAHLRAGIAVFNEGRYHAAHDAWEDYWLDLEDGADERFLHGLIQFTAVIHHATNENWSGAQGLAESAGEYLGDLPAEYRGVNVAAVRAYLAQVAEEPHVASPETAPALTHQGTAIDFEDLDFAATAVAAAVLAEADGYAEPVVEAAVNYAEGELEDRGEGRFVGLLFAFVREPEDRAIVFQRLSDHVAREQQRDADVEGLFD